MVLNIGNDSISFSIPDDKENKTGWETFSPILDRDKLTKASSEEVVGAIIDLILIRKKWSKRLYGKELKL